jgi:hypothetical protein
MIKCPETGSPISTGIQMDQPTFNKTLVFFARTLCPICQTQHEWFARSAWVRESKVTATMRELKWMIIAIFAATGIAAGFASGTAVVSASATSGSAMGRAPASAVAYKSMSYAIDFPVANRTAKGDRLPALIRESQIGVEIERVIPNSDGQSAQNRTSHDKRKRPVAHCEPVVSPVAYPAILHNPRLCFAQLGTFT